MLLRFDPFADLDRIARRLWGEFGSGIHQMPVDAYRTDGRLYLHLDLPGIDPDSIDVEVEKNTLTVRAERQWNPGEGSTVLMSERPHGKFTRQFFLGEGLDTDGIEAGYDHGVLTITIPVAEQAKARKIQVGAGDQLALAR